MKIAILGTRGIPNHYGGFEQYAELLSVFLVKQGFDVTVYNSHNHPYQDPVYKGVKIRHIFDPEKKLGTTGQFLYDLGCILDTRKQKFDVIYQLGYTSSAVFNFLFPSGATIVTNMDGLEWKRSKYNKYVQRFLKYSERIAVKRSHFLVADSLGIKEYLDQKYKVDSFFSAYTADLPQSYSSEALQQFGLQPGAYHLLIARLEPENNVDTIMEAHARHDMSTPLIVVGNHKTKYGAYLTDKYRDFPNIRFVGGIYDKEIVNSIRHYSKIYFHGHSVGGTNPSLLEAMACSCSIIAHNNIFNKSVLENDAWYFDTPEDIYKKIMEFDSHRSFFTESTRNNYLKIKNVYSEEHIFRSLKEKLIAWRN